MLVREVVTATRTGGRAVHVSQVPAAHLCVYGEDEAPGSADGCAAPATSLDARRAMPRGRLRSVLACIPAALLALSAALTFVLPSLAGGGPRNVLLVVNQGSETSRTIGAYSQKARGIPPKQVCCISCPTTEICSQADCETRIREPFRQHLAANELTTEVD